MEKQGKCHISETGKICGGQIVKYSSKKNILLEYCTGAVHFMQYLLEPDPAKRPGVKEAIKDKWLNEGFSRKILKSAAYENR